MNAVEPRTSAASENWGSFGPAMKALPNARWREFVRCFVLGKPTRGAAAAYRAAGLGKNSSHLSQAQAAHKLLHDERVIAAIAEESKKFYRSAIPEAVHVVREILQDPTHKDRARVAQSLINRVDPEIARAELEITARVLGPDEEALEELRALRTLGTSREKLVELFGGNYLPRLEALEARALEQRATSAKLIDAEVIESAPAEIEASKAEQVEDEITSPQQDEPDLEMMGEE